MDPNTQAPTSTPEQGHTEPTGTTVAGHPTEQGAQGAAAPADGSQQPGQQTPAEQSAAEPKPVEYQAFKVPDGFAMHEPTMQEFVGVARELNLTQEQAQKVIDLGTRHVEAQLAALVAESAAAHDAWKAESAKLDPAVIDKANKVFASTGLGALVQKWNEAGHATYLLDDPAFIGFLASIADMTAEAEVVPGSPATPPRDHVKEFYANPIKKPGK